MTTPRSIPRKAIILGIAIGLLIVACASQIILTLRAETWDEAARNGGDVATSLSHDVERTLQTYDLSLQAIVGDLSTAGVMELPPSVRDRVLFDSSIKAEYLGPILVLDSAGTVVIDSFGREPWRDHLEEREFFRYHQTRLDPALHIGHPFKDLEGQDRVTLSRRLTRGDGQFAGVVVGSIQLAYFSRLFSLIDLGARSSLAIALDDGTILARYPFPEGYVERNLKGVALFDDMVEKRHGVLQSSGARDGVDRQFVFQHVGDFPLLLTVAQSTETIYAGWARRALLIGGLTALLLSGCIALAVILQRELGRRLSVERELFAQSERLQVTLRSIGDAVVTTDRDGRILFMNPVAERMSGWSIEAARGLPSRDVLAITTSEVSDHAFDPIQRALSTQNADAPPVGSILRRQDGRRFAVEHSVAAIRDSDSRVIGAVMVLRDVTESRAMARRMAHLAHHDALTGLPNRALFHQRLQEAIDLAGRNQRKVAVLFLDLDRFKHVNDSLGHRAGDQVLTEMSTRLKECVRETDTVSRQGGDEFVVLLTHLTDEQGPARVAESILRRLSQPVEIEGHSLSVTASLGVAIFPDDGTDVGALTKHADAAMYLAKESGRNAFRFFTNELGELALQHLNFEHRLTEALAHDEFILHFQPLCRAYDGVPIGAEALVRWRRDGIIVPPSDFIPIAEECGQIVELGEAILRMACRRAVLWNDGRTEPFVISVNVSAHQFRAHGFVDLVVAVLAESGLAPQCLELEVTESVFLHEVERTETILRQLKEIGISIALDDFGTGYSSLSYLSRFLVDRIKIDRSFVQTLATHPRNKAIVQTIISLGHELGLKVIAEGVETVEQRKILSTMGCLELQGYLFGLPGPDFAPGSGQVDEYDDSLATMHVDHSGDSSMQLG